MATVQLQRDGEEEITGLPFVCMRCGASATRTRSILYVDRVAVPLCEKHWNYQRLARALQFAAAGVCFLYAAFQIWDRTLHSWDMPRLVERLTIGILPFAFMISLVSWF